MAIIRRIAIDAPKDKSALPTIAKPLVTDWLDGGTSLSIIGLLNSDQPGTLKVTQSTDGVGADLVTSQTVAVGGTPLAITLNARYLQFSFTPTADCKHFKLSLRM